MELNKQMEMFEDGGLKDEGGMIDEVSGNDVPSGSTREEVRDDIPAQLSEGEFVFPADVVRFIGLEKLMTIRQKAKIGLQRMESMGQMGNSDEATMPDDMPFDINDIDMEDDLEYNRGGVIQAQQGAYIPNPNQPQYSPVNFANPAEATISTGVLGRNESGVPYAPTNTNKPYAPSNFSKFLGSSAYGAPQTFNKKYIGPYGQVRYIPHDVLTGLPLYPIDNLLLAGFKLAKDKIEEEKDIIKAAIRKIANEGGDGSDPENDSISSRSFGDDRGIGGTGIGAPGPGDGGGPTGDPDDDDTGNNDTTGVGAGVGMGSVSTEEANENDDGPNADNDGTSESSDSTSDADATGENDNQAKGGFSTKRKASGKLKKKYMKQGGLASRKLKKKYMKRGGLASRK
jgi:hypothetical protein